MMGGPESMMMGGPMRPGHSPGAMRGMPPGMVPPGPGGLDCVSPIPGMGPYMGGPTMEQA